MIEYQMIARFYGKQRATRSGVLYIRHIDHGLQILDRLGATDRVKAAYCLHPIVQSDANMHRALDWDWSGVDIGALMLAVEYRAVANAYLSPDYVDANDVINTGLTDVRIMLMADKVQNLYDFEKYNSEIEGAERLLGYFANWLKALKITPDRYNTLTTNAA